MKILNHKNLAAVARAIMLVVPLVLGTEAKADLPSFARFLSPGQLTKSHAHEKKLTDCYACHTLTRGIDDSRCLDCHKDVKERLSRRDGYHGKLQGSCTECHTDHKGLESDIINDFDPQAFNHRLSNYPLTGKHAEIHCDKCHAKQHPHDEPHIHYIGLKATKCTSCHKNPHPQAISIDCEKCHSTDGWSGPALKYTHSRDSQYKLLGKHQEASCEKCHRGPEPATQFIVPNTACVDCHADKHNDQLSKSCEKCHDETGWTGRSTNYSHALDSNYKLVGKHQELSCDKCHKPGEPIAKLAAAKFKDIGTDCINCHTDEHQGQLSTQCRNCHGEFGWKGAFLTFNHDEQSNFKLDAIHNSVGCADCHEHETYKPLKAACVDCHAEYAEIMAGSSGMTAGKALPDPHWKRIRCDQCHDSREEGQRIVSYQDRCVQCHNPRYGLLLLDWMKAWFDSRVETHALFQQIQEQGLTMPAEFQQFPERIKQVEKIGAHNFLLAPLEWKALKDDLEREASKSLTSKANNSDARQLLETASENSAAEGSKK